MVEDVTIGGGAGGEYFGAFSDTFYQTPPDAIQTDGRSTEKQRKNHFRWFAA